MVELYDENGLLNADRFVTYRNGLWQIIGSDNSAMSDSFSEAIITYNKTYLVLKNENQDMYITNYNGNRILSDAFNYLDIDNDFLIAINKQNMFFIYNLSLSQAVTNYYPVNSINDIKLEKNETSLIVSINDKVVETLSLT